MVINDSIDCYIKWYIYIFHLIKDIRGGMRLFVDDLEVYVDVYIHYIPYI